jgi:hypothetical protein
MLLLSVGCIVCGSRRKYKHISVLYDVEDENKHEEVEYEYELKSNSC